MQGPVFLTLDHVRRLHARQIDRFGGDPGIRDIDLIESAIAQPQAGGYGVYYHKDVAEMAAAYLFHLVSNHGFVDGNKRVGAAAALVFLELNGADTDAIDENELEALTLAVAAGDCKDKAQIAEFFRRYTPEQTVEQEDDGQDEDDQEDQME
ncbi:MAG TPA: type II toxin-antitoxin system death-on-curing family toxin [Tepidisphaeraceae bacterium]|jgi:death-on-curing protein